MSLQNSAQDSNRRQIKSLLDSGLAYRTSSSLKIIKEWKTVNYTSAFKLLLALFTSVSTRTKSSILNILKTIDNLYDGEDTPYDIILIRKYSKLFRIIAEKRQYAMRIAIDKIKDYIQIPAFIKSLPFLIRRICIKALACHYKAKMFKKNLVTKTRQRFVFSNLKVRFLMTVCENFLSKKDINKILYNGFRHWYLRTTIKTLYILDSEMTPLLRKRVGIAAKTLDLFIKKKRKTVFWDLIVNQFSKSSHPRNIRRTKEIHKLIEIINTVFARLVNQRELFQLPYNGDSYKLYKLSEGFQGIKSCQRYKYNKKMVKGANLIADIFKYRKLSAFSTFFRIPSKKIIFHQTIKYDDPSTMGSDKMFWIFFKVLKALKLYFFSRLKFSNLSEKIKEQQRRCLLKVIMRNQNSKASQKIKAFNTWKNLGLKSSTSQFACQILFSTIYDLKTKVISNAFHILKHYINLGEVMRNQSTNIVDLYQLQSKKLTEINNYHRIQKLTLLIHKDNNRVAHNKGVTSKFFRRWLQQIPFSNSKLNEYNQLLEILESENNYLKEEINEIRQEAPSPFGLNENRLETKMRFLEFLEIQNSQIIEALENIDILRDAETREIELELLGRPKRSYSF